MLLVGGIGIVDLRIAGAFRALPLVPLARALTPFAIAGLALSAATGSVLFASEAATLIRSPVFQWKLALVGLALVNAMLFRARFADLAPWSDRAPTGARAMALASLSLWLAAATCGRLIAYR